MCIISVVEASPDDPSSDEGGPPGSTPQHSQSNGTGTPIPGTPAPNGQLHHGGGADTPDGRGCCYHPPLSNASDGDVLPSPATTAVCSYHGGVQCDCVLTANNNKDYNNTTGIAVTSGGGGTTVNCVGMHHNHMIAMPPSPTVGK